MKLFTFVHSVGLSERQCGIQSIHAATEIYVKYSEHKRSKPFVIFDTWAKNHKTAVMLQGGNCVTLHEIYNKLSYYATELSLPLTTFNEDETFNYMLTAVALILPDADYFKKSQQATWQELRSYLDTFRLVS